MPAPVVVSGGASGIGAAVATALRARGTEVITVDRWAADVVADLSDRAGRRDAADQVAALTGSLAGVVAAAGVTRPGPLAVSVNYFGVVELLDHLRPALAAGRPSAVVAIGSFAGALPEVDDGLVAACLDGDEPRAVDLASRERHSVGYATSKRALVRWIRRTAPTSAWIGDGIRLNAVAPGIVDTPLVRATLDDPAARERLHEAVPMPIGEVATAADIVGPVLFLLGPDARFVCGQALFVDGGAEALVRPDHA